MTNEQKLRHIDKQKNEQKLTHIDKQKNEQKLRQTQKQKNERKEKKSEEIIVSDRNTIQHFLNLRFQLFLPKKHF